MTLLRIHGQIEINPLDSETLQNEVRARGAHFRSFSQLPQKFMGKILDQGDIDHALKLWYELESIYMPDRDGFKGCGWKGKGNNEGIEKTSFGGQEGCGDGEIYINGEFLQ